MSSTDVAWKPRSAASVAVASRTRARRSAAARYGRVIGPPKKQTIARIMKRGVVRL
jgi:hypothetical protein